MIQYLILICIVGRFRTSSTCIPENVLTKEVRMVRPTKGVSFNDERLALVPAQGAPCVIFSTIPYSKTIRNARYVSLYSLIICRKCIVKNTPQAFSNEYFDKYSKIATPLILHTFLDIHNSG